MEVAELVQYFSQKTLEKAVCIKLYFTGMRTI